MDRGYIKLWRKSIESGWLQNHKLWCFWCWCLLKATHKPIKQRIGLQEVSLNPGQFVFGRKVAAEELGIHESSIFRMINVLKSNNNLNIKTNNKFSIVTIINWDTYQSEKMQNEQQNEQQTEQQANNKRTTSEHKQEHKNINTEEVIQNLSAFAPQNAADGNGYIITRRKRKLTGKRLDAFLQFWDAFGYKKGKAEAADAWLDIPTLNNAELAKIIEAAKVEATGRSAMIADGRTPKMAQGWISGRRWEDEHQQPEGKRYDTGRF